VTSPGFKENVTADVGATDEFWLSEAFVTTENTYEVPGVRPVIVNDVVFAFGCVAIVQFGVQLTKYPVIPAPARVGAVQFNVTDVVDVAVALSPVT